MPYGFKLKGGGDFGGGRCRHPRQRQHFRLRRRGHLPLDLNSETALNRSDQVRPDVVLHPTDDDLVGEIRIRNERHRRVQRGVGEVGIVGSVAVAIVCEDGVAGAGDHIGLPIKDGVADEAGGGPSVSDGHIVKMLGSIWVHGEFSSSAIDKYTPESIRTSRRKSQSSVGVGVVGVGESVGSDEVGSGANGQFV